MILIWKVVVILVCSSNMPNFSYKIGGFYLLIPVQKSGFKYTSWWHIMNQSGKISQRH